jgi:two-component system response regulator AtoC
VIKAKILIIDDEPSQLELLRMFLTRKGYVVESASSGSEGIEAEKRFEPDVVILDIHLPDMDGLEVLQHFKKKSPKTHTIMVTAYHDMETTVKAMKLGAYEYITKPIDGEDLERAVVRALNLSTSNMIDIPSPEEPILQKGPIIGNSKPMQEIFKVVGMLCENRVAVLIEGETGTGKELIAKAIHYYGPKRDNPFIAINCSAIVGTLLESELFGHEKGAFTGAILSKKGKFELAGEGTIFLDEISEIPIELQAKLLRFLQEKEFQRVGGEKNLRSNARVIAATNRHLWDMVKANTFREDLYYRLSVVKIHVPPLRERKDDIGVIVKYLLKKINSELDKNITEVDEKSIRRLKAYDWPGNVRELENVLINAAVTARGNVILDDAITPFIGREPAPDERLLGTLLSLREMEREHILKALTQTNWNITKTGQILGISRPTLRLKIREYKIERSR